LVGKASPRRVRLRGSRSNHWLLRRRQNEKRDQAGASKAAQATIPRRMRQYHKIDLRSAAPPARETKDRPGSSAAVSIQIIAND
jgi:hypothetical protein